MPSRISRNRKITAGTYRSDRQRRSPIEPLKTPPPPPDYLSKAARIEWLWLAQKCVDVGCIVESDLRALALLAETLASERKLRAQVERDGHTYIDTNKNIRANPASRLLESTRNQAQRLLESFGLTPRAREGVAQRPQLPAPPSRPLVGLAKY